MREFAQAPDGGRPFDELHGRSLLERRARSGRRRAVDLNERLRWKVRVHDGVQRGALYYDRLPSLEAIVADARERGYGPRRVVVESVEVVCLRDRRLVLTPMPRV